MVKLTLLCIPPLAELLKKQSFPEIVFAHFHNKYGQKALVDEYVGSLVNTLTRHQKSDLRLQVRAPCMRAGIGYVAAER